MPYLVQDDVIVSGDSLLDAHADVDQRTSEPVVVFRFNDEGAKRFEQATEENVGRPFAILLDELVISAPIIREPIRNGFGQISGNFTEQSASGPCRPVAKRPSAGNTEGHRDTLRAGRAGEASTTCAHHQSRSFCPSRPASPVRERDVTRPERLPCVVAHSSASARSASGSKGGAANIDRLWAGTTNRQARAFRE